MLIISQRTVAINYVDPQEIYELNKDRIFYSEDLNRSAIEYEKDFKARVKELKDAERNKAFTINDSFVLLVFFLWFIFPLVFLVSIKQIIWMFIFPFLFFLFGFFNGGQITLILIYLIFGKIGSYIWNNSKSLRAGKESKGS